MTYDDLVVSVHRVIPHASFGEDNDGQVVIYTNLIECDPGLLQDMDSDDLETFGYQDLTFLKHLPSSSTGEDNDGQIVIYTNMREEASGHLVMM